MHPQYDFLKYCFRVKLPTSSIWIVLSAQARELLTQFRRGGCYLGANKGPVPTLCLLMGSLCGGRGGVGAQSPPFCYTVIILAHDGKGVILVNCSLMHVLQLLIFCVLGKLFCDLLLLKSGI